MSSTLLIWCITVSSLFRRVPCNLIKKNTWNVTGGLGLDCKFCNFLPINQFNRADKFNYFKISWTISSGEYWSGFSASREEILLIMSSTCQTGVGVMCLTITLENKYIDMARLLCIYTTSYHDGRLSSLTLE